MSKSLMRASLAIGFALSTTGIAHAQQTSIKIGYAISKTGPYTGGASVTTLPNYQLWVKDVNAAGGIMGQGQAHSDRSDRV